MVSKKCIAEFGDDIVVRVSLTTVRERIVNNYPLNTSILSQSVRYWVDTPRDHYVFTNEELMPQNRTRKRAIGWAAIISETDCRDDQAAPGYVPVPISARGKPYTITYIFAIHNKSTEMIAEKMGLTVGTVQQYISDVINHRR